MTHWRVERGSGTHTQTSRLPEFAIDPSALPEALPEPGPASVRASGGTAPAWLADAVIYEIYPQSFADSDGDGIGDLTGALQHLDYLQWLGVDVIWFNPCFDSPFRDAGYDIRDYLRIAPRYGTNDDMVAFVAAARERGIRVLLDLVAGHTSVDHPWFHASMNDAADDRYIWAAEPAEGFIASPGSRAGWYLKNFFAEQPALNFGYARFDPREPWRQPVDAPGPRANRAALREVVAYWLDRGVAGFRVDMAFSLVKDDPDLIETTALWRELRDWMHDAYPERVLLPESDEGRNATAGVRGGFDADFALVIHPEHSALFNNGGAGILPWQEGSGACYFDADADVAQGARMLETFLNLWDDRIVQTGANRLVVLPSADHDFSRLACGSRAHEQLAGAFTFLLTWGSIPSIYFGDEIGMRYVNGLPDTEGSVWDPRFNRAGCRTPMQWDDALPNAGFSTAAASRLYLPQDPDPARPTVRAQLDDPASLLHHVRHLVQLRRQVPALRTVASRRVLYAGYPVVYLCGETHLVVVNPRRHQCRVVIDGLDGLRGRDGSIGGRVERRLAGAGVEIADGVIRVDGFGHGIFELGELRPADANGE